MDKSSNISMRMKSQRYFQDTVVNNAVLLDNTPSSQDF